MDMKRVHSELAEILEQTDLAQTQGEFGCVGGLVCAAGAIFCELVERGRIPLYGVGFTITTSDVEEALVFAFEIPLADAILLVEQIVNMNDEEGMTFDHIGSELRKLAENPNVA